MERHFKQQFEKVERDLEETQKELAQTREGYAVLLEDNRKMRAELVEFRKLLETVQKQTSLTVQAEVRATSDVFLYGHQQSINSLTRQVKDLNDKVTAMTASSQLPDV